VLEGIGETQSDALIADLMTNPDAMTWMQSIFGMGRSKGVVTNHGFLPCLLRTSPDMTAIFEGAQGVLLDENHG
jgi:hypothetical protein